MTKLFGIAALIATIVALLGPIATAQDRPELTPGEAPAIVYDSKSEPAQAVPVFTDLPARDDLDVHDR
jgi:hypothetical protein